MTIEELKAAKHDLEILIKQAISPMIETFQDETGVIVSIIGLMSATGRDSVRHIIDCEIKIDLEL
jgi:hypothetical protein